MRRRTLQRVRVLRQFHTAGFVNQFAINPAASTASRLIFESENFENPGSRFRARETYSKNHFRRVGS